jgi:hypothetical protein
MYLMMALLLAPEMLFLKAITSRLDRRYLTASSSEQRVHGKEEERNCLISPLFLLYWLLPSFGGQIHSATVM